MELWFCRSSAATMAGCVRHEIGTVSANIQKQPDEKKDHQLRAHGAFLKFSERFIGQFLYS
jgi:hypothetical protein